jgi:hypothetical protein
MADFFPGRVGKQCRERWHNQLRPNINRVSADAGVEGVGVEEG